MLNFKQWLVEDKPRVRYVHATGTTVPVESPTPSATPSETSPETSPGTSSGTSSAPGKRKRGGFWSGMKQGYQRTATKSSGRRSSGAGTIPLSGQRAEYYRQVGVDPGASFQMSGAAAEAGGGGTSISPKASTPAEYSGPARTRSARTSPAETDTPEGEPKLSRNRLTRAEIARRGDLRAIRAKREKKVAAGTTSQQVGRFVGSVLGRISSQPESGMLTWKNMYE